MTEKQWIAFVLVVCVTAPLHWFGMKWLSDRHAFCRDSTITLDTNNTETQCEYPEQRVTFEHGITHIIAVCRCRP